MEIHTDLLVKGLCVPLCHGLSSPNTYRSIPDGRLGTARCHGKPVHVQEVDLRVRHDSRRKCVSSCPMLLLAIERHGFQGSAPSNGSYVRRCTACYTTIQLSVNQQSTIIPINHSRACDTELWRHVKPPTGMLT
jgi:hypothetical protein